MLVRLPARETPGWGYRRIHGEQAGLGVKVAASTAWEILKASGLTPPGGGPASMVPVPALPGRRIRACDFFTVDLLNGTPAYVLAVIEHATRRIRILGITPHPTGGVDHPAGPQPTHGSRQPGRRARFMIRDRGSNFTAAFDAPG
jgi:putative transposase